MKIFELEDYSGNTQLIALIEFLKQRAIDMNAKPEISIRAFSQMAQNMGITVSFGSLKNIVNQPPLSNVISKIDAERIYFKTPDDELDAIPSSSDNDSETTVDSMAKKAMHKRS